MKFIFIEKRMPTWKVHISGMILPIIWFRRMICPQPLSLQTKLQQFQQI